MISCWQFLSLIDIVYSCFLYVLLITILSLQGEMQQLRDRLAITERTAKSEAQLKVIIRLCLLVLGIAYLIISVVLEIKHF